ncbi:putative zinc-binding protein [Methylophaga thiooxydans]|uniref:Putative zinc-binding protein n=1 Tax=Methylophaga thiooxydans TaxID=392484 RepID=A0A0A0BEF4_9GAMM|nr:DUF2796 domain-containing protein [Methylophaga thiooxydans]KGM06077.1 putative zinc-binding protein [Methylophaga thiooxydans]
MIMQAANNTFAVCFLSALFSLGSIPAVLAAEDHHEHHQVSAEAHVHGKAELNIVVQEQTILIEFISPLENLLGFEHAPANTEQEHAYDALVHNLADYQSLFSLTDVRCEQTGQHIEAPFNETQDAHAEWHGEYHLSCTEIGDAASLKPKLFSAYPGVESLSIQLISEHGQSQLIATKDSDAIPLH